MFKHILFPTDGSETSMKALDTALLMARAHDARLCVLTVFPPYPPVYAGDGYVFDPISTKEWKAINDKRASGIRDDITKTTSKKRGGAEYPVAIQFVTAANVQPYKAIVDTAKKRKCDLIVMASHGRSGFAALLLGSETTKVLTHTKIPVLVCR